MSIATMRAFAACMLCLASSAVSAQDAIERLRVHGSNTMGAQLVPALVESWLQATGYTRVSRRPRDADTLEIHARRDGVPLIVEIGRRGSASGMADLIAGDAELAMMTRRPNARELDAAWQLGDLGSPEQEFVIALDGIVALVHVDNPVRELDIAQLRAIYAGRVRNWSQLGGPDLPLRPWVDSPARASGEFFRDAVMYGAPLAPTVMPSARTEPGAVADRGAIRIVALRAHVPAGMRPLAISDGGVAVDPAPLNVLSEDYPLLRRYSLYGGQMMSALGRSFALYTMTRAGQAAVAQTGHFAVTLRPVPQPPPPVDAEHGAFVAGARRLPLSLRFNADGMQSIFDSRAVRDLDRLAALMRLPRYRDRQVLVVAFGNHGSEGGLVSTMVSNDRADIVAGYLQERGIPVRRARGFGPARMLAAPTRSRARYRNERVEVWVL